MGEEQQPYEEYRITVLRWDEEDECEVAESTVCSDKESLRMSIGELLTEGFVLDQIKAEVIRGYRVIEDTAIISLREPGIL